MNKFLIRFKSSDKITPGQVAAFAEERISLQAQMRIWCIENIGTDESYPHWQFEGGYFINDLEDLTIHTGIYIFDAVARTAFKLKFGL